jgi:hypothetical protein
MKDDNEYGSISGLVQDTDDLTPEIRRGIRDIEAIRGRRCLCYVANVIQDMDHTSISTGDHLPFSEMVDAVPRDVSEADVFLATAGGSAEQVTHFVDALRQRFTGVEFIVAYKAMSAGALWALSGDRIWMDERAFLGPIDPQVPSKDGRFVPAQALVTLLDRIEKEGQDLIDGGREPRWTYLQIVNSMDYGQLGTAFSASEYSIDIARRFLNDYKFKSWTTHRSDGRTVSAEERLAAADKAARALCSHERWKVHGHALKRGVIWDELRIEIDHPEKVAGLERAIRRLWALLHYVLERTAVQKLLLSNEYSLIRTSPPLVR